MGFVISTSLTTYVHVVTRRQVILSLHYQHDEPAHPKMYRAEEHRWL